MAQNDSMQLYKRLIRTYVMRYRNILILGGFAMIIVAATTASNAYLMKPIIDGIFFEKNTTLWMLVPLALIGIAIINGIGDFGQMLALKYVGQRVVSDMQGDLFAHLLRSDITLFHDQSTGRLISRLTNDIMLMRQSVSQVFTGLIKESLTMIFLAGVMIHHNWRMSLIALFILVFAVLPVARLGRRMRKIADSTQAQLGDYTAQLEGTFQGVRMVKAYGREEYEVDRARKTIRQLFKLYYKAARVQSFSAPMVSIIGSVAIACVLWYGGYSIIHGNNTAGEFTSFLAAMIMAYRPVKSLAGLNTQLHEGMAAAKRFFVIMDTPPTIQDAPDAKELTSQCGKIEFDHVSFTYAKSNGGVKDLTFTVPPGKTVALVGASGSGKSTIMNLLLRFYDIDNGSITIDGQDIRSVTMHSLRNAFALVSQDIVLFDDTVRANIAYGRLDATDEEIIAAATKANAHEFIAQLPDGYNTVIGPMGVKLSGGQRQRISIARAVLKDAPILLLDEATSALDTASERVVQAALETLMQDRTTLVIAHRLSTIQHADTILVLDQGRILDSGTHEELLSTSPIYKKLQHIAGSETTA